MTNYNCDSCEFCDSCEVCYSCKFCNSCEFCNSCYSCKFCEFCDSCKFCNNLVNGFMCINLKFEKQDDTKYWIFNKEVTKEEWDNRFKTGELAK